MITLNLIEIILAIKRRMRRRTKGFYASDRVPYEYCSFGRFTYGSPIVKQFYDGTKLRVGGFCSIGKGVTIYLGGDHRKDWITTYPFSALTGTWPEAKGIQGHPATKGDVVIGNDVWIAEGATILSGVHVGDGAIIGARAVVTKSVEPYTIVAGNPARVVGKRFDDETIKKLLDIRWWDWPEHKIRKHIAVLCSPHVEELLRLAKE